MLGTIYILDELNIYLLNFPLKTKLLLNEKSFYEDEIIFLYLYLRKFKEIIEKHLDNTITNDEKYIEIVRPEGNFTINLVQHRPKK